MEAIFGALWVPCLILCIVGIALLIIELFLPGFGVSGIMGILCLAAVIVIEFLTASPTTAYIVAAVLIAILILMIVLFMRSMKKGLLFRSPIVLKDNIEAVAVRPSACDLKSLIGKQGTVVTPLRPSGIVQIEGQRYSVESQAVFVEKDAVVTVIAVDGTKITVA